MKVLQKDKSKLFLYVKLDKQDLISIYRLLKIQLEEVGKQKEGLNDFYFHIDGYEVENENDIRNFDKQFKGSLSVSLTMPDNVRVRLEDNHEGLSLAWSDEHIKSSGIANKIIGILESKERRFLRHFFSFGCVLLLSSLVLAPLIFLAYEYIDKKSEYFNLFITSVTIMLLLASYLVPFWFLELQKKYQFKVRFSEKQRSVFATHAREIKVGIIVALFTVLLTVLVQYLFKNFYS